VTKWGRISAQDAETKIIREGIAGAADGRTYRSARFTVTSSVFCVGAIAIGAAAIVVSMIFNVLSLRASSRNLLLAEQTFVRTEQRYILDRLESRNDKVRAAVVDLMTAIEGPWSNAMFAYERALVRCGKVLGDANSPQDKKGASLAAMIAALNKLNEEAAPALMAATTNLRLLAEDISELRDPIAQLAEIIQSSDRSDLPAEMPTGAEWYFDRARSLEAERKGVTQLNLTFFSSAIELFRQSGGELPT
jgi:hypothetical protein